MSLHALMLDKVEYCETLLQPMKTQMGKNNKKEMFPVQPLVVRNWPNHDKHNYSLSLFMIITITKCNNICLTLNPAKYTTFFFLKVINTHNYKS